LRSLAGAALILALTLYPYVYMFARTAFAEQSQALYDAADTVGLTYWQRFMRVSLPLARPAVVAGLILVMMETVADFGTVSHLAVDTFTAGIYRAWQGLGDLAAAAHLAALLLIVVLGLAWAERRNRQNAVSFERARQPMLREPLRGLAAWLMVGALLIPVLLGFGLPLILLVDAWRAQMSAVQGAVAFDPRLLQWAFNSLLLGLVGAALVLPLAILIAYGLRLNPTRWVRFSAAVAGAGYAVPGLVLAIGLLTLGLPGGIFALLYVYVARFFSVAHQGIRAGLERISPSLDDSARSLGLAPWKALRRVHLPILKPSLATAALLVFVDCVKELPGTLVLRPFNLDTLAVSAYQFASDERFGAAAAPALLIVLVALIPTFLLAVQVRRQSRK
jgi:iron(III) transport system permease protein